MELASIGLIAAIAVVLLALQALRRRRRAEQSGLPYRAVDSLMTKAERSFYGVLLQASADTTTVFSKVRLADLLWLPSGVEGRLKHLNRITAKHVDFVLCDRQTLSPRLVIELDDSSHRQDRRRERDQFLDAALRAAQLPLLRVSARRVYSLSELSALLSAELEPEVVAPIDSPPQPD